tara:strand:+ start:100 stop:2163 length:2064 start_codon:yes stop_codon:yes gene_type:complete
MFNPAEQNFIGRDPMQWWIGQVTDPVKGEWDTSLENKQAEDGKDVYSHRCRVRIVGYHGCEDDLPDKDLPLAHVLLPPNTATTGGCGDTLQYQGGEVVVGFFFDGADAQQPVIFGTLFKQPFIKDELTTEQFNAKKQTCFVPYTPPKVRQMSGKDKAYEQSPWGAGFRVFATVVAGKVITSSVLSQKQSNSDTNVKITNTTACEDNEISKMTNVLKDFTEKMKVLQDIGNLTVDPLYGGVIDKTSEIKLASIKMHNSMSKLMRRGRSWMIQDTLDKLNLTLKDKTPISLTTSVGLASKGLTDIMFCNIEKINEQLGDYLEKSLANMLGSILDVPLCAVESFLGDMFGQINNILDTVMGDLFDQLNNIQGGGIGLPSKAFQKGINFANILTNALECDAQNCPENTTFTSKGGLAKNLEDSFGSVFGLADLSSLTDPISDLADGLIPDISVPSLSGNALKIPKPDCKTNVLKCGPPRIDFIGGGFDKTASGSAVVNTLGNIIGVAISDGGSGYKEPPLLTFVDGCDNGYGAGGYAVIENGKVVKVVMTDGGQEYIPNTTETDIDGNVKEVIPDPNGNYDGEVSYITSLSDLVVENTGFGYEETDTVTIEGSEVELDIRDGRIVGANIINAGSGYTSIPEVIINSDTGCIAKLSPVLQFTRVDDAVQRADTNIPFNTELPVVTVIDCVTK